MPGTDLNMVRSFLLSAALSIGHLAAAQNAAQWIQWGDMAMARGDHYGASRFYGSALESDGGKMEAQWKMAEACRLCHRYPEAEENYAKVVQKDRTRMHPEAQLHLAEMQMCNSNYKGAEESWKKVKQKEKDKKGFTYLRAEQGIAGCAVAQALKDSTTTFLVVNIGEPVNSYDSDFGARFGPDSALWFSSLRGDVNDDGEVQDTAAYRVGVYSAQKAGAAWNPPMKEQAQPDAMGMEHANLVWAPDGDRMLFTQLNSTSPRSIAVRRIHGPVERVNGLGEEGNTTQPWIARIDDREVLLFASDRTGGRGGMDIWLADLNGNATTNVRNAGPLVNTPGNETCPAFDENDGTLWFSSDFHAGLGGYDIFRSAWKNGLFNAAANASIPINSPANDLYPVFNDKTGEGWLTSNRIGSLAKKGETCCNDLYRWKLPRIQLPPPDTTAIDSVALVPIRRLIEYLPLKLYFHNDEPDPRSWSTTTEHQYDSTWFRYKALVPTYEREYAGMLDGDARTEAITSVGDFFGNEAQAGYDKLMAFLVGLQETLDQGRRVNLVVRGFASPLAKSDYNVNLSLRRIQSLVNVMRVWNNGSLVPYLDGRAPNSGSLTLERAPFGEEQAKSGVSDQLKDLRKSVYDPDAARERRIEIERVEVASTSGEALVMEQQVKRVGKLVEGVPVEFVFDVKNNGTKPLRITEVKADCGCTTAQAPPDPIEPGSTVKIPVQFSGRAPQGDFRRTVRLITDGEPTEIELILSGIIVPAE
ncbi:MAG: DUF1573 domain-containing protein [Flavobacteriales bacterium]|nr:DUF1573 domain-containing protein [Flavobacteriales bacterium]